MTPVMVDCLAGYMGELENEGYTFLTWNGVAFDYQVIAANCGDTAYSKLLLEFKKQNARKGIKTAIGAARNGGRRHYEVS